MLRYVLLALMSDGQPVHGYALMKAYEERSGIRLSIGNIYRELQGLVAAGLIAPAQNQPGADARRSPSALLSPRAPRRSRRSARGRVPRRPSRGTLLTGQGAGEAAEDRAHQPFRCAVHAIHASDTPRQTPRGRHRAHRGHPKGSIRRAESNEGQVSRADDPARQGGRALAAGTVPRGRKPTVSRSA